MKANSERVATPDARILREAATGVVPSTDIFGLISTWEPARTLHLRPIGIGEEIEAANISIPLTLFGKHFEVGYPDLVGSIAAAAER